MKMFWKISIPVTCVVLICGAAITWQVSKERKLADAAKVCRVRAEQGDAMAEYDLGRMYYHGQGAKQNFAVAARWFREAADQGNARAQYGLGYMYYHGQGVPQDYPEAARWYKKAADQGYAKAQTNLASMYVQGQGVPQDYTESTRWYRKSAEQGDATGQDGLGFAYYHGDGVLQDNAEAARWYRKAADQGYAKAQYDLGSMYYHGFGVPQDRAEAYRWYHKAADQGDEYAQRALGLRGPRFSTLSKINLSVISLGCVILLIGSLSLGWKLQDRQKRSTALTAILGLIYVGLGLYWAFGIFPSISVVNTFYFGKSILGGVLFVTLISIVWPEREKPKSAKIALGISGIFFIVFNVFAMAHYDLRRLTAAIRLFCLVNGLFIGISISLAIFLSLTYKNSRGSHSCNSRGATSETPAEI